MTNEEAKEILWNRCQHTPETAEAIRVLSEKRPQVIDNCDMNVFEPEKYMKDGAE